MGKSTDDHIQKILREVGLQGLNKKERKQVLKILREEAGDFCIGSDDIGNVTECKMKIQLKDQTPVQKTYYSMPKSLHLEIKHYIEDLLNKGWITKSASHYSSPIVAVRKKDESLRLCCDCRSLNSKTQVYRHPRIQDVIDNLKGKNYFSVLD